MSNSMSFEPLTPEEQKKYGEFKMCTDPQHTPPSLIVIREPMKWVCPSCGAVSYIYPNVMSVGCTKS